MSDAATPISDALYYPYIHFRDEAWLKGTLLFFPHIVRMLPSTFAPKDSDFVNQLKQKKGRGDEPLVQSYPLDTQDRAHDGILNLVRRIAEDGKNEEFKNQFTLSAMEAQAKDEHWDKGPNTFQIHRDKLGKEVSDQLRGIDLVWDPTDGGDPKEWVALHPRIGEALMATAAAAAALHLGLEIVTDSPRVHGVAATAAAAAVAEATLDEEAIYQVLVNNAGAAKGPNGGAGAEAREQRVAQIVFATRFDLSKLTADDLAKMSRETNALFGFRDLITKRVARVRWMQSPERLEKHLKEVADDIVREWEPQRRTFSNFFRRLRGGGEGLIDAGRDALEGVVNSALTGTAAGVGAAGAAVGAGLVGTSLVPMAAAAAAPALVVGLGVHSFKTWRSFNNKGPTTFLSRLEDRIGTTTLGVASPAP